MDTDLFLDVLEWCGMKGDHLVKSRFLVNIFTHEANIEKFDFDPKKSTHKTKQVNQVSTLWETAYVDNCLHY